jgi:hypothetical protein
MDHTLGKLEEAIGEEIWTCHVCHCLRPDSKVSVYQRDISAFWGLAPGSLHENIRFCNDKAECFLGSSAKSHFSS